MRLLAAFVCGFAVGACVRGTIQPPRGPRRGTGDLLTARQRQILMLVGRGLTTKEIAGRERISDASVRTHIRRAHERLGVHSRAAAVAAIARLAEGPPLVPEARIMA